MPLLKDHKLKPDCDDYNENTQMFSHSFHLLVVLKALKVTRYKQVKQNVAVQENQTPFPISRNS
jgi:hypothetical protein